MKCGILEITHIVWMIIFCVVHKYWTKIFLKFNLLWRSTFAKNKVNSEIYPLFYHHSWSEIKVT